MSSSAVVDPPPPAKRRPSPRMRTRTAAASSDTAPAPPALCCSPLRNVAPSPSENAFWNRTTECGGTHGGGAPPAAETAGLPAGVPEHDRVVRAVAALAGAAEQPAEPLARVGAVEHPAAAPRGPAHRVVARLAGDRIARPDPALVELRRRLEPGAGQAEEGEALLGQPPGVRAEVAFRLLGH